MLRCVKLRWDSCNHYDYISEAARNIMNFNAELLFAVFRSPYSSPVAMRSPSGDHATCAMPPWWNPFSEASNLGGSSEEPGDHTSTLGMRPVSPLATRQGASWDCCSLVVAERRGGGAVRLHTRKQVTRSEWPLRYLHVYRSARVVEDSIGWNRKKDT